MKPTPEDEIRIALIEYGAEWVCETYKGVEFLKAHGYSPDGSWLPKRYAGLIMRIIAKHLDKKPKKK